MLMLAATVVWSQGAAGTWLLRSGRPAFPGVESLKSISLRVAPHLNGEVFTIDILAPAGATTSSSILYLDAKPRPFQDVACSGTQTSWRRDEGTVEILRQCAGG